MLQLVGAALTRLLGAQAAGVFAGTARGAGAAAAGLARAPIGAAAGIPMGRPVPKIRGQPAPQPTATAYPVIGPQIAPSVARSGAGGQPPATTSSVGGGGGGGGDDDSHNLPAVLLKISAAGLAAGKAIQFLANRAFEGGEKFRRFSPQIAASFAKVDRARLMMDVKSGKNTGGSFAYLGDSIIRMERSLRPWKDAAIKVSNYVLGGLARAVEAISEGIKALPGVGTLLEDFLNKQKSDQQNALMPHTAFLKRVRDGKWKEPQNKRPGERN